MIAAVKVRGDIDAERKVSETFDNLNLESKNQLVLLEDNDPMRGMLKKVKDYVAYGELSEDTVEALEQKKDVELEEGDVVSLSPPSGGYRSTKKNFSEGGALGDRKNLDKLVKKMM